MRLHRDLNAKNKCTMESLIDKLLLTDFGIAVREKIRSPWRISFLQLLQKERIPLLTLDPLLLDNYYKDLNTKK